MSNALNFKRTFFILKKEYSNMRNVSPKGHGKLELRNNRIKISINIDNAEENTYYNVILVGDNRIKDLGKIHTDKNTSGRVDFHLNYKDVESMGFPLEKINGILILRDKNILLGAYIDKGNRTIESYIDKLMQEDPSPVAQVEEDLPLDYTDSQDAIEEETAIETEEIVDELIFSEEGSEEYIENDLFVEADDNLDNLQEDYFPEDSVTQESNEFPIEEDNIAQDKRPYVSAEEYDRAMQEIFEDSQSFSSVDESPYEKVDSESKLNQKNQTTNYVLNILNFFPYIEPFKIDLMGYNWWRIDIDDPREDKGFLPYFSYIAGGNHKYPLVQNTVTATALMREHGHYLFGLYNSGDEVKFYVYGVPGDFTKEDHPQKGTTGFNTWFEGRNGIGYWLLYIDPTNGRVIYPINPMIPKE